MTNNGLILLFSSMIAATGVASATTITFGGNTLSGQGVVSSVAGATTVNFESGEPLNYSGGSVTSGNVSNVYLEPTNDTSKYLTSGTGTVSIDFSQNSIKYFGIYWGSFDAYNTITLSGNSGNESYTGTQIANLDGFQPDGSTSQYVNFFSGTGSSWSKITLSSTQNAFESDNHAFITATPEPSTTLLLGTGGLMLLAAYAGRRRAQVRN